VKQIVQTDGIALMHTRWIVSGPRPMTQHAIEVACRQADGTWRWLIGDPFTVEREVGRNLRLISTMRRALIEQLFR